MDIIRQLRHEYIIAVTAGDHNKARRIERAIEAYERQVKKDNGSD